MKSKKLVRCSVCHDVHADPSDELNNGWHKGWRLPDSKTTAFFFKKKWWASGRAPVVTGPFKTKEEALNVI